LIEVVTIEDGMPYYRIASECAGGDSIGGYATDALAGGDDVVCDVPPTFADPY
jgi:hypothetical protein